MDRQCDYEYEITEEGIRLTQYTGTEEDVRLPEEIGGVPVTILGSNVFYDMSMDVRTVDVPGSFRRIETNAFNLCLGLERLELHEGLKTLEEDFLIVTQQEELRIPSTVSHIIEPGNIPVKLSVSPDNPWYFTDDYALYRRIYGDSDEARPEGAADLKEPIGGAQGSAGADPQESVYDAQDGVAQAGSTAGTEIAFRPGQTGLCLETTLVGVSAESYRIPEGVTAIAADAFENQEGLQEIWLPSTMCDIGEGALADSRDRFRPELGIRRIHLSPDNPWYFLNETGMYRHLESGGLKLVKYFGHQKDLILGEEIREIGSGAFINSGLQRIILPPSMEKLNPDSFFGCPVEEVVFGADEQKILCPAGHPYLQKQVLDGFGANGKMYDYRFYDRALDDEAVSAAKMKLICYRLLHPVDLPAEMEAHYRKVVGSNLDYTIDLLMEQHDSLTIRMMSELGFFTADNIDHVIDRYAGSEDKDALAVLMDYRHGHFTEDSFDFSL